MRVYILQATSDLVSCLDYMMKVGDDKLSQEQIWQKIIAARHVVNETKVRKSVSKGIHPSWIFLLKFLRKFLHFSADWKNSKHWPRLNLETMEDDTYRQRVLIALKSYSMIRF